ncbi:unnamed protein product, partial [Mesorhabditis spiculigera]
MADLDHVEAPVATEPEPSDPNKIVDTPITWEIVEQDFQKAFNTTATIGPNRTAKVIGDGRGFVSKMAQVEFDWTTDTEKLPKVAVLKITTCDKMRIICEQVMKIDFEGMKHMAGKVHDSEWNLYDQAANNEEFVRNMRLSKYYCGRGFDYGGIEAGYLAIELIENFAHRHFYHTVQDSAAREIVGVLAKLTAYSLKHPEIVDKMDIRWMDEAMGQFVNRQKLETELDNMAEKYPDRKEQVEVFRSVLWAYDTPEVYLKQTAAFGRKILVHGDMWPGNIIWDKDAKGDYHVRHLIDWQVVHLGTPLEDLLRILSSAVTPENYKDHRDSYLEHFYDTLKHEAPACELPWASLSELIEQYEKFVPLIAIAFMPMFMQMEEMLFRTCDASEKEECLKCFYSKIFNTFDETEACIKKWWQHK